jgi:hypothetical protein
VLLAASIALCRRSEREKCRKGVPLHGPFPHTVKFRPGPVQPPRENRNRREEKLERSRVDRDWGNALEGLVMRSSVLAWMVVAASAIAFPAAAQQQQAAPSEQTAQEMHGDVDKGLKTSEPNAQMQREADKGVKTRNSGASGYVADQDKPGASAHPPGRPESEQTTGSSGQSGAPK